MRATQLAGLGVVAVVVAACGGGGATTLTTKQTAPKTPAAQAPAGANHVAATSNGRCLSGNLSLRLGAAQGAAGSTYEPIVFTNHGSGPCTLTGYPGVSFVAPKTGKQVGAAATRNPQHAVSTVTLAPGASASATVQIAQEANYPASTCQPTTVSGLRVYPPGSTTALYAPFAVPTKACSTNVDQLHVAAVVSGAA